MAHKKKERIDPLTLEMPYGGIDTHAHLVSGKIWDDVENILERAEKCGISHIGEIFLRHESYLAKKDFFKENIFYIYGLHPTDLNNIVYNELDLIREDIALDQGQKKKIKAIGEIGLDYYWKEVEPNLQQIYFRLQLKMAKDFDLPVVVHSREAFDDTVKILLEEGYKDQRLLWHCFDADSVRAKIIIENGWHISVPGSVTYKGNDALRSALHTIPKDRLMLETDCPYLSPEPWRGTANEPSLTVFTAKCIADELGRDKNELWLTCGENAKKFFNLVDAE